MKRRTFLATAAGGTVCGSIFGAEGEQESRHWVEIRTFWAKNEEAKEKLLAGLNSAAVSNRKALGFSPVGLFTVDKALHEGDRSFDAKWNRAVILVTQSATLEKLALFHDAVLEKIAEAQRPEFVRDGEQLEEIEVSLHRAFPGCPAIEVPTRSPERVIQLRRYFSPNLDRNRAKRNMFDVRGELDLFRRCGMAPVFFTETVFGSVMPNVTYMLSFENDEARRAGWNQFVSSDEWKRMSGEKEFENTATRILNLFLRPASSSEI